MSLPPPRELPLAPASSEGVPLHTDLVPIYLTPGEVADMLQLSPKTIYRLVCRDPTMPMLKLGGSVRFPRERLLKWLQAREQGPGRPRQRTRELVPTRAQVTENNEPGAV